MRRDDAHAIRAWRISQRELRRRSVKNSASWFRNCGQEETRVSITSESPKSRRKKAYEILPEDHRAPYEMREVLNCFLDGGELDEFQADYAKEMICATARIGGILVGVIANSRGMIRGQTGKPPKFGGIVYTESAEKTAYFIENCNRHGTPLLFVQDVSGFMVGADAEHSGIIRAGARFVEAKIGRAHE